MPSHIVVRPGHIVLERPSYFVVVVIKNEGGSSHVS